MAERANDVAAESRNNNSNTNSSSRSSSPQYQFPQYINTRPAPGHTRCQPRVLFFAVFEQHVRMIFGGSPHDGRSACVDGTALVN